MSKTSSDDQKGSASTRQGFSRLVGIIARFSQNSRRLLTLSMITLIAEQLTSLVIPVVTGYAITYVTLRVSQILGKAAASPQTPLQLLGFNSGINPDVEALGLTGLGIIALTMLNSLCDSLTEIYLAQGGRGVGYNMRVFLYGHLQKLSLSFHNQSRTGDILTRVTSDVAAVEDFIISNLSNFLGSALYLVMVLGVMFWQAWHIWRPKPGVQSDAAVFLIPLLAVSILPFMTIVTSYFNGRIKAASKKLRSTEGELASAAQEMLASIRVVQVYGQGDYEQSMFSGQSQKAMNSALELAGYQARFSWAVSVMGAFATAAVIGVGAWIIFRNPLALQVGMLYTFIKWIDDMFKPTKKLISEWNAFGKLYASLERVGGLMDLEPEVRDEPGAITAPPLRGRIEFRNVVFSYPSLEPSKKKGDSKDRPILNGLSFTIQPGQVVAVVGHTGAGKSTIAQLIPRLYDPNEGQILIDGRDIRSYTLESLRGQMSMVLQEAVLFTGSILENIAYGRPTATGIEIVEAAKSANADEFISKYSDGYYTQLGERGSNLSGGQRQRLSIARAFIRDTPILILDEPSTGLDAESTELVHQALRKLMKGKTTIIISHELNLIRDADKIIVIKDGKIEQTGTHDELLRAGGLYANLYIMQSSQRALDGAAIPISELANPKTGKD
jgi:ATP-binding cassette, subfamily B, bacterial